MFWVWTCLGIGIGAPVTLALVIRLLIILQNRRRCVFCDSLKGKIPSRIEYQDNDITIIHDIKPASKVHLLVIPNKHTIADCYHVPPTQKNISLIKKMEEKGREIGKKLTSEETQFEIKFMRPPFNSVFHLHLHVMSKPVTRTIVSDFLRTIGIAMGVGPITSYSPQQLLQTLEKPSK